MTDTVTPLEFLRLILGGGTAGGWIETRAIPEPKTNCVYTKPHFWHTPEQAAAWLSHEGRALNGSTHGLFFGAARRVRKPAEHWRGGKDEHVDFSTSLWADLDWKGYKDGKDEAANRLQEIRPAPTVIVCSGGGYHAYWRLRQLLPAALVRTLNRRLVIALASDKTVVNPGRVLRVPGAWHRKNPEKLRPVSVVGWHPELRYDEHAFRGLPALPRAAAPLFPPAGGLVIPSGGLKRGSPLSRYAHGALLKTCDRVASAPDGQKHRELFKAAIRLGQFCGVGLLFAADVSDWLLAAVARAGAKDLKLAEKTIHDGLMRGMRETPNLPDDLLDR